MFADASQSSSGHIDADCDLSSLLYRHGRRGRGSSREALARPSYSTSTGSSATTVDIDRFSFRAVECDVEGRAVEGRAKSALPFILQSWFDWIAGEVGYENERKTMKVKGRAALRRS